jgi:ribose 5-phosphate isomerase RpiB
LSARVESAELDKIVNAFLTTQFEGGRHSRRLDKIRAMEC